MSRSIHTTRRTLADLRKTKFATRDARRAALKEARAQLRRKRTIKAQVKSERNQPGQPLGGGAIETIPVEFLDRGPYVHHALSLDDTRKLLARLQQAGEAVSRIRFCLGKEYMEEFLAESGDEADEADPFTGRPGSEWLPGIFTGPILGTYFPGSGSICVYANVYDPQKVVLPREVYETYLRLRAAATLVHEIAHHHDHLWRVRGGRWLSDRKENSEHYAEKMEHRWGTEIVVPFFEQNYPAGTKALIDWVEHHGGIRLPLEFFLGDPRVTGRDGSQRLAWTTPAGFEELTRDVAKQKEPLETRLGFAWELHFADEYALCLRVLETVLAQNPSHLPALDCKADTLVHLERYDEAMLLADFILDRDISNKGAWHVRANVFQARGEWQQLLDVCDAWEQNDANTQSKRDVYMYRAVAFCGLDRLGEMEAALDAWMGMGKFKDAESAAKHRGIRLRSIYRRAGKTMPEAPPEK